ncbi:MAG: energy-coupling factor transporter transmembrane component T family protein [Candidatus Asgardarchaeia archaeon]
MSLFKAFTYSYKDTIIHRLDPRSKLLFVLLISLISLIYVDYVVNLILLCISLIIIITARVVKEWLATLKSLLLMIVLIFIFNLFIVSPSYAFTMILRLLVLASAFSVFFLTVHPDDFSQALIQMHIPFDYAFAFSMAVRFIPTLAIEAQTVIDAQRSRGLELEKGNPIKKVKNYIPILAPLVVSSIRRAIQIAESLEARGFGALEKRTSLYPLKFNLCDYLFVVIAIVIASFFVYMWYIGLSFENLLKIFLFYE